MNGQLPGEVGKDQPVSSVDWQMNDGLRWCLEPSKWTGQQGGERRWGLETAGQRCFMVHTKHKAHTSNLNNYLAIW